MDENFVPEMHDLGKLIVPGLTAVPTTDGKALNRHGAGAFGQGK